jgi:hypothetical protein
MKRRTVKIAYVDDGRKGQLVIVRQRTYTVTDVIQSATAAGVSSSAQQQGKHLVTLSAIEDDAPSASAAVFSSAALSQIQLDGCFRPSRLRKNSI